MTSDQLRRAKEVLEKALELDSTERGKFLDYACGDDLVLRQQVEDLLASDQNAGEFLSSPLAHLAAALELDDAGDYWLNRRVGPYRILREIGRGGMGTVYLAERADGEYRKQVAIKAVNSSHPAGQFLRRFRHERQVLAELDHPHIARLLEGGATEDGLPYLVMEHVEGIRIDTWCDRHELPVRNRIELFRHVCGAVQYAHEHQVIHRDIKPGNILVTTAGVPKLLDFGIAKVLNPELYEETGHTTGIIPMTPAYASPEQARGEAVGPASDIFSLGVVLHQLLTGRLPAALQEAGAEQPAESPAMAASGDLGRIVGKALSSEPGRRYLSVAQFSEDLGRFLDDRPVSAHKASLPYRAGKFLKRNRLSASLAGALFAALITALLLAGTRPAVPHSNPLPAVERAAAPADDARKPEAPAPPPAAAAPKTLAVIRIENRLPDQSQAWMEDGVRDLLTTGFAAAKGLQVISAARVRELAARKPAGTQSPATSVRDLARETRADFFLNGALLQKESRLLLEFQVRETGSGRALFDAKVEGAGPQALVGMTDEATGIILARLVPGEVRSKSTAAAALTGNLEALKAYEEGLANRTVFRARQARAALGRAIELDPQFILAHYQLADLEAFNGRLTEARRSIARAVQLGEHGPVPRLQKMLAEALQMRLDLRLEEAARVLSAAHQEFPKETEPLFQLASIRSSAASFAEAAALLEEIVRLDPRHALAHDQLGYQYAFLGDLKRALASIDRYAALLPPGNDAPACTRADAYMITGRYDDATAEFRRINYLSQAATAALYSGNYALAQARIQNQRRGSAPDALQADLSAARGQLDQALPYYEAAVEQRQTEGPMRPWFALLSAARIPFEQSRPAEVLALARRHNDPWAAGLRGAAYLLLNQGGEAEKEFAAFRDSIAPLLGDHVAQQAIEFHRMQAALYAGHFDQVIRIWPRLPRSWWPLYALDVGRAYLETGAYSEAEHHLRLARQAQQGFFMNNDRAAQHNFLTGMLAQFYLAQILTKTGRRIESADRYQDFVQHFDQVAAPSLPQVVEARKAIAPLRLSPRGRMFFSDEFSGNTLDQGWDRGMGIWEVAEGLVTACRSPERSDRAFRHRYLAYHDAAFEFSFRMDPETEVGFGFGASNALFTYLTLAREHIRLRTVQSRVAAQAQSAGGENSDSLDKSRISLEPGKWHTAVVEMRGSRILVELNGKLAAVSDYSGLDVDKNSISLSAGVASATFDYIRAYEIGAKH